MGGSWGALGAGIWEAVIGAMYHGRERQSLHPTRDSRLPCCHSRGHTHSRSASHTHQHQYVHASPIPILLSAVAGAQVPRGVRPDHLSAPSSPSTGTGPARESHGPPPPTLPVSPGVPRAATPAASVYRHRCHARSGSTARAGTGS